jgi:hypothetical protein
VGSLEAFFKGISSIMYYVFIEREIELPFSFTRQLGYSLPETEAQFDLVRIYGADRGFRQCACVKFDSTFEAKLMMWDFCKLHGPGRHHNIILYSHCVFHD